jgi:hypothetical protein
VLGVLGLGLIFTAAWAAAAVVIPPGQLFTIINYVMYFASLFIVGLPTYGVLRLFFRQTYSIILAVIIWAIWIFGVKYLFVWLIGAMGAGK